MKTEYKKWEKNSDPPWENINSILRMDQLDQFDKNYKSIEMNIFNIPLI